MEIRRMLDENHSNMRIIAKLENQEGVNNVDEILAVVDGVMIARGDMGVEIDFTEIPVIQKDIIAYTLAMANTSSPPPRCWTVCAAGRSPPAPRSATSTTP